MSTLRLRARLLAGLLLVVTVASCGDVVGPTNDRAALDRNRDLWEASGHAAYSFTLSRACFCIVEVTQPSRVVVRNDSVVSVTAVSDGRPLNTQYFPTVNALFEFIDEAIANNAHTIRVVYDPVLGYPVEIDYDGSLMIADDEISYRASAVTRTP